MTSLTREVRIVQNCALGATVIWRFVVGYTQSSKTSEGPPLPLGFIVLPVVFHEDTVNLIGSTRGDSGLHAFADKFAWSENKSLSNN
jgi:4-hydroxybenzoate polyprenyltransferase